MSSHSATIDPDLLQARIRDILEAGRFLDARGWAPATAGNYSVRLDRAHLAITVSGCAKGQLGDDDVMLVGFDGTALTPDKKSSAETLLHCQLMADFPAIGAVLHTHSVASTVLTMADAGRRAVTLAGYELLKALEGFDTHCAEAIIPIFENSQDMNLLARQVRAHLAAHPPSAPVGNGRVAGYLIRGHGLYTWGTTMSAARRHVEALEFLFACELERLRLAR